MKSNWYSLSPASNRTFAAMAAGTREVRHARLVVPARGARERDRDVRRLARGVGRLVIRAVSPGGANGFE